MSVTLNWNELMKDSDDATEEPELEVSQNKNNSSQRKRTKSNISDEEITSSRRSSIKKKYEVETNPDILQRRQKQIDYGKNTVGYWNYSKQVPINQRSKDDPKTPDKYMKYSRRSWDTLIQMWRLKLHKYDPDPKTKDQINQVEDTDADSAKS